MAFGVRIVTERSPQDHVAAPAHRPVPEGAPPELPLQRAAHPGPFLVGLDLGIALGEEAQREPVALAVAGREAERRAVRPVEVQRIGGGDEVARPALEPADAEGAPAERPVHGQLGSSLRMIVLQREVHVRHGPVPGRDSHGQLRCDSGVVPPHGQGVPPHGRGVLPDRRGQQVIAGGGFRVGGHGRELLAGCVNRFDVHGPVDGERGPGGDERGCAHDLPRHVPVPAYAGWSPGSAARCCDCSSGNARRRRPGAGPVRWNRAWRTCTTLGSSRDQRTRAARSPLTQGRSRRKVGKTKPRPFANEGRIGPDREPGGVAGVPRSVYEKAGGLVEVGVPGRAGRVDVGRLREGVAG